MPLPRPRFTVRRMMLAVAIAGILLAAAAYRRRAVRETALARAREGLRQVPYVLRMEAQFLHVARRSRTPGGAAYFSGRAAEMHRIAEAKKEFAAAIFDRYGVDPQR